MIVGRREKFDIVPFLLKRGQRPRTFPSGFFSKYHKFGIVRETRGASGERTFTCYVYNVRDGAKVELRRNSSEVQIFEYIGTLAVEVQVEKEVFFKESELIKGFMGQNLKDAVKLISVTIGAVSRIAAAAAGIL